MDKMNLFDSNDKSSNAETKVSQSQPKHRKSRKINLNDIPFFKFTKKIPLDIMEAVWGASNIMLTVTNPDFCSNQENYGSELFNVAMQVVNVCINEFPQLCFTDGIGQNNMKNRIIELKQKAQTSTNLGSYFQLFYQCYVLLSTLEYSNVLHGYFNTKDKVTSKLFLISEDAYKSVQYDDSLRCDSVDLKDLAQLYTKDTTFEIFVEGKGRASRLGFHVEAMVPEDSDGAENGDFLIIYIWDRCVGLHEFRIDNIYDKPVLSPCDVCTIKGADFLCKKALYSKSNSCVKYINDCPSGYLQMAYTVLRCLQEYLINKDEQRKTKSLAKFNYLAESVSLPELDTLMEQSKPVRNNSDNNQIAVEQTPYKSQRVEGKIIVRSFEDFNTDVVYHAPHKPHASTEKCPHVRSGYYRTSKNGKVSWVKSCVIHKDKFSEYASADEL